MFGGGGGSVVQWCRELIVILAVHCFFLRGCCIFSGTHGLRQLPRDAKIDVRILNF